jgi:hypothetical protein
VSKLIIVDYIDGAGGEYLSYFISSHKELRDYNPVEQNMQIQTEFKFLNSQSLVVQDWEEQFTSRFNDFIIKHSNLAVPYHLYKWKNQVDQILSTAPQTRFVKIDSCQDDYTVKIDFLRKIWLKKLTLKDLPEIKFSTSHFDQQKNIALIQRLKSGTLIYLDMLLINDGAPINQSTRLDKINDFLNKTLTPPTNDVTIKYRDFFIDFSQTKTAYINMCDELNIQPDNDKLNLLLTRNKKNYSELQEFIKNFNTIKENL